jgi:large repetitive protein
MKNLANMSLLLAAALLTAASVEATDLIWVGDPGGNGNWNAATNWSPAQVPTAADNTWITNNGTYTVTVPAGTTAVDNSLILGGSSGTQTLAVDRATLTINGASTINPNGQLTWLVAQSVVTGAGNLAVNGVLNWADGTMSGTGVTTIGGNGVLGIGSGGVTLGRTLNNGGNGTWAGGNLTISPGNTFNNLAGGTFDITADGRLSGAATTPINNSGLLRLKAGTSVGTTITAPLNNSANLQVLAPALNLNLGGTHIGTFSNAPGSTLNLGGGSHALTASSSVKGAGTLSVSGGATLAASGSFGTGTTLGVTAGIVTLAAGCNVAGTTVNVGGSGAVLNFNSASPVAAINLTGGTLGGTSPINVTGPLTLRGGSVTNSLVTASGGLAIAGNTTLNGAKVVNPGTAIWSAGNLTGANGAAISNLLGATFINTFDGNAATGAGATPLFVNAGSFQKTNGTAALGTTSIDFQFLNTGTVEVRTNTLRYNLNQQTAGLTMLDGGDLSAQAQPIQLLGGSLVGTGLVTVANTMAVINSSSLSPGLPIGELAVSGNYQQTASGVLNIDLGGYTPGATFDLITVGAGGAGGVATLGGALNVTLANGFSPTNGATFTFLTAASRVGAFATFNYPSNDIGMQVSYDATSAKVTVSNLKPVVVNPLTDPLPISYGQSLNYQFPANTFADPEGGPLTYTASGLPPGVTFTGATRTFSGTPTQAGAFLVTVTATDGGIPSLSATNAFTLTINPAVLTVTAQPQTKLYGGTDPALTYVVAGLQLSDTAATVLSGTLTRAPGESVPGSPYAVTQGTLAANANYTLSFAGNTLAITPATLSITAQAKTKTYGATDPSLTFTVSGLQFTDTQTAVLTGALTRAGGETVAGSPYAIMQGTLAANGNYTISFTASTLAITPASLAITAQARTKTYGATDPALTFTVSGLQFTDTQASVLTGALTRAVGESVAGSPYAITKGTLAANGNYTISFTGNTLAITPATLAITTEAKTKSYGATDPALTFTVNGLQFTDTQASVLTGALTRAAGESVAGSPYAITQGTLAATSNYTISFAGSSLAITPATLTITAQPNTKSYRASDPTLTFTVNGLQFTDTQASVLSGALTRATGESVADSPYPITQGTLAANGNYTISFTGSSLAITPVTLEIKAQTETKSYGAADPALTFTVSGLQFTDTQALVLTGALTRAAGESVAGSPYAITQGTLTANGNYTISFTGNTLAITPVQLSITADSKSKTFSTPDPVFTVTYDGFVKGDTASALGGVLSITRVPGESVGNYTITPAGLTSTNYTVSFNTGTLTITAPASIILSLERAGAASIVLTWNAVSNASYRVQYRSQLDATTWTDLAGVVLASASTASKIDVLTPTNRFYRVQLLP